MPRSSLLAFFVASASAFIVWALSPWLTGFSEPWDAPGIYYPVALFLAGTASGVITGKPLWAHYTGGVFGQFFYEILFLPMGPLAVVGLLFMVVWSLLFLLGACLGALMRSRYRSAS